MDYKSQEITIDGKPLDDYVFEAVIKKLANMMDTSKKQPSIDELQCQAIVSAMQCDEKNLNNAMIEIAGQNINIAPLLGGFGRKDDA